MTWEDRIKKASYISPQGQEFFFDWDETEESFDHNASIFRFPDKDGAEIPDRGIGEKRYPITTFIHGPDYDLDAKFFMDLLSQKGPGILLHPMYGRKTVQVTSVKRVDKVVEQGNVAAISVLFIESKKILVRETEQDLEDKIDNFQGVYLQESPEEFANQKNDETAQDSANVAARIDDDISIIDKVLGPIAELNDEVNAFFQSVQLSMNNNLTTLVGNPLTLASQLIALIKTPARIAQSFSLRVEGYKELATQLRAKDIITSLTNDARNSLLEKRLMLSACVSALAETMGLEKFNTKNEALLAAFDLEDFFILNRDFIEAEESKFQSSPLNLLLYGDSNESATLNSIVQLTATALSTLSFNLKQERIIELARERNLLELSFELFGNINNENLDSLIASNGLKGDEIILIPQGREIIYYV